MKKTDNWKMAIQGNVPSKSNCYKIIRINGNSDLCKQPRLKQYEKDFFIQCPYRGLHYNGYFKIDMKVFYPSQRSDLDNSLKIVLDCLQKPCYMLENDNKCVEIHVTKHLDKEHPRIELEITPVCD